MDFHQRLKRIRIEKGHSKGELASLVGIHYSQIGRYEEKGSVPSAEIMTKLANCLGVTADYLMNGSTDSLAQNSLIDKDLLNQFKAIEKMEEHDKSVIKTLIDAFIAKSQIKKIVSS